MIVDDYEPLRIGLRAVFEKEADFEVVADMADGESAVAEAERMKPDVVVMNVRMPSMKGIEACRLLRDSSPDSRVVMLTSSEDERVVTASMMAGAHSFLLKRGGSGKLLDAARAAARDEVLMDPRLIQVFVDVWRRQTSGALSRKPDNDLSNREKEVLALVSQRLTNRQIALRLTLSENTVKNHVSNVLRKLGLHSRYEIGQGQSRLGASA